jgi:hypothetical protein
MLIKSKRGKTLVKSPAKSRWHFSPSKLEKRQIAIQEQDNKPPDEQTLNKLPLLRTWMERGRKQVP